MAAQIEIALASDARAMSLLGVSGALSAGAAAVFGTVFSGQGPAILWASGYATFGFLVSSAFATASAWPRNVQPLGWNPEAYISDVKDGVTLEALNCDLVDSIERRLEANGQVLLACGRMTKAAMVGISVTIVVTMLVALLVEFVPGYRLEAGLSSVTAGGLTQLLVLSAIGSPRKYAAASRNNPP